METKITKKTEETQQTTSGGLKSDLMAITDLIGKFNKDSIHAMFGASQVGKTTLQLQLLYEVSHKLKRPVLLYDTEGGAEEFIEHWDPVYRKVYPDAEVDVRLKRDFKRILKDHGKLINIKMSGDKAKSESAKTNTGGKMGITVVQDVDPSPMLQLVLDRKYAMVLYDSITLPMKYFGSEQQNFPARSTALNLWFGEMMNIIDDGDCYVFASHHSSKNPADPYAREQMAGGNAVQYYSKIILYMKKWSAKGATSYRSIKLARYFNKPPNEFETLMKLTDEGYIDATKEDMELDKKSAK